MGLIIPVLGVDGIEIAVYSDVTVVISDFGVTSRTAIVAAVL
jgi:hypothetical protein